MLPPYEMIILERYIILQSTHRIYVYDRNELKYIKCFKLPDDIDKSNAYMNIYSPNTFILHSTSQSPSYKCVINDDIKMEIIRVYIGPGYELHNIHTDNGMFVTYTNGIVTRIGNQYHGCLLRLKNEDSVFYPTRDYEVYEHENLYYSKKGKVNVYVNKTNLQVTFKEVTNKYVLKSQSNYLDADVTDGLHSEMLYIGVQDRYMIFSVLENRIELYKILDVPSYLCIHDIIYCAPEFIIITGYMGEVLSVKVKDVNDVQLKHYSGNKGVCIGVINKTIYMCTRPVDTQHAPVLSKIPIIFD